MSSNKYNNSCGIQPADVLANIDTSNLVALPEKLTTRWLFVTPMLVGNAAVNFASERQVFQQITNGSSVVNGVVIESTLLNGTAVDCPFLMCGLCVSITPEPEYGSASGGIFDVSVIPGPTAPSYGGGSTEAGVAGRSQGTADFGKNTQNMAIYFLMAYEFRFLLQCKYELFSTKLSDIGCIDSPAAQEAAGSYTAPGNPLAQRLNAQYAAIGLNDRFMLPNKVDTVPVSALFEGAASAPTISMQRGGPDMHGNFNGFMPCPYPILLSPCCNLNAELFSSGPISDYYRQRLIEEATPSPKTAIVPEYTNPPVGDTNGTTQLVHNVKFGALSVDFTLIGVKLEAAACQAYASSNVVPRSTLEVLWNAGAIPKPPTNA